MESFPAQCCKPLPRRLVEHILSLEVIEAYKVKANEHYTSRVLRVYCANDDCRRFIPKEEFDNLHTWYTIARCQCGTNTCVGCKQLWLNDRHRCLDADERGTKPDWLPEYSAQCRIKQCPDCRMWIEHKDACNHMTCCYCRHEFCFVCLLPCTGENHDDEGCPSYGDPPQGYDEEGYERSARGLHQDTGFDRNGRDRLGRPRFGVEAEDEQLEHPSGDQSEEELNDDDEDLSDDEDVDQYSDEDVEEEVDEQIDAIYAEVPDAEVDAEMQLQDQHAVHEAIGEQGVPQGEPEMTEVAADQIEQHVQAPADESEEVMRPSDNQNGTNTDNDDELSRYQRLLSDGPLETADISQILLAMAMQPVVGGRRRRAPPSDIERHRIHRARRCAIFTLTPTNPYGVYPQIPPTPLQFEHNHTFYSSSFYNTAYRRASCSLCHYGMPSFFHYCQDCGIVVCRMCSESFRFNSIFYQSYTQNLVSVITWAEDGVVPFRAEHKYVQQRLEDELDSDWGVAAMFEAWEVELYQSQPFMYSDFGTKALMEETEHEAQKVYWIVTEENVGLLGRDFQMTFRLDTNRYAPLFWEHDIEA